MVFALKTPSGAWRQSRTIVDEVLELAPERSFAGLCRACCALHASM